LKRSGDLGDGLEFDQDEVINDEVCSKADVFE
jgi:hypothetical protein